MVVFKIESKQTTRAFLIRTNNWDDENNRTDYLVRDGLLYHIAGTSRYHTSKELKLALPASLIDNIVQEIHSSEFNGGLLGIEYTYII